MQTPPLSDEEINVIIGFVGMAIFVWNLATADNLLKQLAFVSMVALMSLADPRMRRRRLYWLTTLSEWYQPQKRRRTSKSTHLKKTTTDTNGH